MALSIWANAAGDGAKRHTRRAREATEKDLDDGISVLQKMARISYSLW
jgi:hypothetical protein